MLLPWISHRLSQCRVPGHIPPVLPRRSPAPAPPAAPAAVNGVPEVGLCLLQGHVTLTVETLWRRHLLGSTQAVDLAPEVLAHPAECSRNESAAGEGEGEEVDDET